MADGNSSRGYFDRTFNARLIPVSAGEYNVSREPGEMFTTTLGSCISVCLFDRHTKAGGMNHIMLPGDSSPGCRSGLDRSCLFGDHSMEVLINSLLRHGTRKGSLEAKVFGGANVLRSSEGLRIGEDNSQFAMKFLDSEKIPVLAMDVGGYCARRIIFEPVTGKVYVNALETTASQKLAQTEFAHRKTLSKQPVSAKIEIFR